MKKAVFGQAVLGLCMAAVLLGGALCVGAQEQANQSRWYVSPAVGMIMFEGDEAVRDGFTLNMRLGYDFSEWWSFESIAVWMPLLDENLRHDVATGADVSRLEEVAGPGVHDTWGLGLAFDGLFHFTRWDRLDPYLAGGLGFMWYADDLGDGSADPVARVGGGVMYHFNDEWSVRADGRFLLAGSDTEANELFDVGVVWNWGARLAPDFSARGGPSDSDGDGLTDHDEINLHATDPYDPDTDDDGLSDGQEVNEWRTNPLIKDTDFDGLVDGYDEVQKYHTNPLKRDTDDGGVADGHEVIEDATNPLDGSDDLMLFELNINFDYDKAIIKEQYFHDLNIVAKVLSRNADATARVEGHADKNKNSKKGHNQRLSQQRAESVTSYFVEAVGLEADRFEAVGYGFDRPKAPNTDDGNPVNRRVEIYVRGVDKEKEALVIKQDMAAKDTAPADK